MQADRDYVPKWMLIHGYEVGVMRGGTGISIQIRWTDQRGLLMREGVEIEPSAIGTIWTEEHWTCGLEGLIKMTIEDDVRRWAGMVDRQLEFGASWRNARVLATAGDNTQPTNQND